jgi:hypothetical protein
MLRPPAEIAPSFRAAKLLVERIAPGPRAQFGRYRLGGNDVWHLTPRAEAFCERADDAADGKSFDRGADIARPGSILVADDWAGAIYRINYSKK